MKMRGMVAGLLTRNPRRDIMQRCYAKIRNKSQVKHLILEGRQDLIKVRDALGYTLALSQLGKGWEEGIECLLCGDSERWAIKLKLTNLGWQIVN